MFEEVILLKLGELVLKGLNRTKFEDGLVKRVRYSMAKYGAREIYSCQSTIYVTFNPGADVDGAEKACLRIFGIVSVARAAKFSYDLDEVKEGTKEYLEESLCKAKTFKVTAKRADKTYPLNSPEIMDEMGGYLLDTYDNLSVDLHNPDTVVCIEVREGSIYVHSQPKHGAGGLPTGMSGHGLLMLSGGIDSPVAGWMMGRRGMRISAIHFESPPYTSERAKQKVIDLASVLSGYTGHMDLYVVPFTQIQEEIRDKCKEQYFTVIMRRYMLRIACLIADRYGAGAIITGESLGQVASQTLDAIRCTDAVSSVPVFRPLIGTDKQEIVDIARKIDTFETSSLPYEDCCTVFTPKHPKTTPTREEIEEEEKKLNTDILLEGIVEKTERIRI